MLFHRYKFLQPTKLLDVASINFCYFQPNFYFAGIKFPIKITVEKKNPIKKSYKTDYILPLNASFVYILEC